MNRGRSLNAGRALAIGAGRHSNILCNLPAFLLGFQRLAAHALGQIPEHSRHKKAHDNYKSEHQLIYGLARKAHK
jgi:hypothetical protein